MNYFRISKVQEKGLLYSFSYFSYDRQSVNTNCRLAVCCFEIFFCNNFSVPYRTIWVMSFVTRGGVFFQVYSNSWKSQLPNLGQLIQHYSGRHCDVKTCGFLYFFYYCLPPILSFQCRVFFNECWFHSSLTHFISIAINKWSFVSLNDASQVDQEAAKAR